MSENIQKIQELYALYQGGIITEEDFLIKKKQLLESYPVQQSDSNTYVLEDKAPPHQQLPPQPVSNSKIIRNIVIAIASIFILGALFWFQAQPVNPEKSGENESASSGNNDIQSVSSISNSKYHEIGVQMSKLIFKDVTPKSFKTLTKRTFYLDLVGHPPYNLGLQEMKTDSYHEQNESAQLEKIEFEFPEYRVPGGSDRIAKYGPNQIRDAIIYAATFSYSINMNVPRTMSVMELHKYENLLTREDFLDVLKGIKENIPSGFRFVGEDENGFLIESEGLSIMISYRIQPSTQYNIDATVIFDNENERLSYQQNLLDKMAQSQRAQNMLYENGSNLSREQRKEIEPNLTEPQNAALDAADAARKAVQEAMNK